MSSSYSNRKVISMDIYRIMKQLNLDEKTFTLQSPPSSYKDPQSPDDGESKK